MTPRPHLNANGNEPDPGWGTTLRQSATIGIAIVVVSALFWTSFGSPELQARAAKAEMEDVSTPAGFAAAHGRLVDCAAPSSCVAGTSQSARERIFWAAASASGALRYAASVSRDAPRR